jgi:putative ABC transport system substrate-binding protein
MPGAIRVDVLVNPADVTNTESTLRQVEPAGRVMGLQIQVLNASTSHEIDGAFSGFARERPDALFVGQAPFLASRRVQLILQAAHHRVPASYPGREFAEVGGLISYGSDIADAFREAGIYVGRILKGAKPAELPVVQSNKIELVINHQTARVLSLTVPPTLLATADEVIE